MKNIANRLKTAREHAGLSQGQVAKILDMHRPTVSEIEAGRRKVSADELATFAKIYDVSISWLTDEEEENPEIAAKVKLAARDLTKLKTQDLDKVLKLLSMMRNSKDAEK